VLLHTYVEHNKAYRFIVIESNASIAINIVIESIDLIFYESRYSSIPKLNDLISTTISVSNGQEQEDIA